MMPSRKSNSAKASAPAVREADAVYSKIREILESARSTIARTVNSTQVIAHWLIGREIVLAEQSGSARAKYGARQMEELAARLKADFGQGYSVQNLRYMRQFFLEYPRLLPDEQIHHTLRGNSSSLTHIAIRHTACGESGAPDTRWEPGVFHSGLAWSLYRHLLKVKASAARAFYEVEAVQNRWSARELERQINSLLFERLARSKDKAGLMRLATQGQQISAPSDVFKDPVVIEFLGLPESPRLVESDLEAALVQNLQAFLLELGKGFAFVARQKRITLDGDHFYIDLVFYHTILKCHVLIDLKVGKLTHADLGQMQLYVNYFDRECRTEGDQPTLELILCTDKNEAVVRYLLSEEQSKKIFTSRYHLHLPSEKELAAELKREFEELQ